MSLWVRRKMAMQFLYAMNFLHKHYLSRKDIEACLACDLSEFDASPFRGEVEALIQVLQTKAEE